VAGRQGGGQTAVLADQQFSAAQRQRQHQIERSAFALADDGIEAEHQCDQWYQVDDQADQAGDGDGHRAEAQRTLLGIAEVGDRQRERGEYQRHHEYPAVAQPIAELLAGDGEDDAQFRHGRARHSGRTAVREAFRGNSCQ
jgi:hypothetical protein